MKLVRRNGSELCSTRNSYRIDQESVVVSAARGGTENPFENWAQLHFFPPVYLRLDDGLSNQAVLSANSAWCLSQFGDSADDAVVSSFVGKKGGGVQ